MRDPDLVERAQRAASALERAWDRFRAAHGLGAEPLAAVSSYVGYSLEEPWGEPRVVFGVAAEEAEKLAALLNGHDCGNAAAPGKPAVANGRLAGLTAAAEIARAAAGARLQVPAQPPAAPRERFTNGRPPAAPARPDDLRPAESARPADDLRPADDSRLAEGPRRADDPTAADSQPRPPGHQESTPEPPATVIPEVREPSPAAAVPPLSPAGVTPPLSPAGWLRRFRRPGWLRRSRWPGTPPLAPAGWLRRSRRPGWLRRSRRPGWLRRSRRPGGSAGLAGRVAPPVSPLPPALPLSRAGAAAPAPPPDPSGAQACDSETGLTAFRPGAASLPDDAAEPVPFGSEHSASDGGPAQRPRSHRHAMPRPARQKRNGIAAEADSQQPARQPAARRGGGQRHASNAGGDGLAAMAGDLAGWASGELPGQAARQTAPWTPTYRDPDDADPAGGNPRIDKLV